MWPLKPLLLICQASRIEVITMSPGAKEVGKPQALYGNDFQKECLRRSALCRYKDTSIGPYWAHRKA